MKHLSVAAGIARTYVDYAADHGADRDQLMAAAGIVQSDLDNQDARFPLVNFQRLLHAAKDMTGNPAFALHHAMDTELEKISVVGLIVHTSKSFVDSMEQLNRYAKLMIEIDVMEGDAERFSFEPSPEGIWIVDNRPNPNSFPELSEMNYGRFASEFSREFPNDPFMLRVEVTHPAPAYAEEYVRVFKCPVEFNAPRNAMLIGAHWMEVQFDEHIEYAFGVFTDRADQLLDEMARAQTLSQKIEAHILPVLHRGEVSVDAVASDMGMSRQTLYRRLKEEGKTFAEIFDDLRYRLAADYLSARKITIDEAAYLVGFSEASSFVRAFRRWTGMTPAQYRAKAQNP